MSQSSILPVKPGTISTEDKAALREIGVVVIECEDPSALRLVRADTDISAKGMLYAAILGMNQSTGGRERFAEAIYKQVCESRSKGDAA